MSDRYQHQPWYVKLWRRRHYVPIPYTTIRIWLAERKRPLEDEDDWLLSFKSCWGLATGLAQANMNWVYDWDEVKNRFSQMEVIEPEEDKYGKFYDRCPKCDKEIMCMLGTDIDYYECSNPECSYKFEEPLFID